MTDVTRQLTPSQRRELALYADGQVVRKVSTNLIRRDLVRSVGRGQGYRITPFGLDVLAGHAGATDPDRWGLTSEEKGNTLAAIDQFTKALAFDDRISYRLGAKQVAATQRDALIEVVREILDENPVHPAGEIVDAILDRIGGR